MATETIDIIIPAYNASQSLTACLLSIWKQTFKAFRLTVVNDGSTDDTAKILKRYSDRLNIIEQSNQGASAARNAGAKQARAEFIIFVDADIILQPKMLEIMHKTLVNHSDASYAYSAFKFGRKKFKLWKFSANQLRRMPYIHTTSLIRRKHFPGFDEKLKRFQDWDLWLTMLVKKHHGIFIKEILFKVKAGGMMSTWLPSFFYVAPMFKKHKEVEAYQQAKKIIFEKHHLK